MPLRSFVFRYFSRVSLLFLLAALLEPAFGASVRIATYNILNFPDALGYERLDELRTVMTYVAPDVVVVQEMIGSEGTSLFLDSVMHYVNSAYTHAPFHNGPDTDNALFYRSDRVDYLGATYHTTPNRDIAEYRLAMSGAQTDIYLFSVHFKASQGLTNEQIRLQEATILRERLDALPAGSNFIVAGDFNIYYSDEPAFQMLTDSMPNVNGMLIDPLHLAGNWHENSTYASVHTQSTRVDQLPDGGATGGMDDRFDMILCSAAIIDTTGLHMIDNSYTICGNDGAHFNLAINYGYNSAVPPEVADGLYWASDHLPISLDLDDEIGSSVPEQEVMIWPNPLQTFADVVLPWHEDFLRARITMTNILGQRVYEEETQNPAGIRLSRGNLPVGVYFLHIIIETTYSRYQYRTRLAIIK
jgi:endonuclease/exonuclease/phosphatase family metal-dependent hydrolase